MKLYYVMAIVRAKSFYSIRQWSAIATSADVAISNVKDHVKSHQELYEGETLAWEAEESLDGIIPLSSHGCSKDTAVTLQKIWR